MNKEQLIKKWTKVKEAFESIDSRKRVPELIPPQEYGGYSESHVIKLFLEDLTQRFHCLD